MKFSSLSPEMKVGIVTAVVTGIFTLAAATLPLIRFGEERRDQQVQATATVQQATSAAVAASEPTQTPIVVTHIVESTRIIEITSTPGPTQTPFVVTVTPSETPIGPSPTQTLSPTPAPIRLTIDSVRTSSSHSAGSDPRNLIDGNTTDCWLAGENPEAASITISFREPKEMNRIAIFNEEGIFWSRFKDVTLIFDNSQQKITLDDFGGWQEKALQPVTSSTVVIQGMNGYPGQTGAAVGLCEIQLYGK